MDPTIGMIYIPSRFVFNLMEIMRIKQIPLFLRHPVQGSFYTALSRVKYGEKFYLKGFESTYIKANPDVEKKILSMKVSSPYIFCKIYNDVQIFNDPEKELKIGYININSLYHKRSYVFINTDRNLMLLDFLVVADTRLNEKHKTSDLESDLSNWKLIERLDSKDGMIHMGLLLLQSARSEKGRIVSNLGQKQFFKTEKGKKVIHIQILSVYFLKYHLSAAFVYKHPQMKKQNYLKTT